MRTLASYSDPMHKIRTKTLRSLIERDERIVGFTIEDDGVFIYTDAAEWCDDAGAGTFRGDTETGAVKQYREQVQRAEPIAQETDLPGGRTERRTFAGGSIETALDHFRSDSMHMLHFIDYGAPNPARVDVLIDEFGREMVGELLGGIDRALDAYVDRIWLEYSE